MKRLYKYAETLNFELLKLNITYKLNLLNIHNAMTRAGRRQWKKLAQPAPTVNIHGAAKP
jgi:hypothetical protein